MTSLDVFSEWARWGWLGLANHVWQATLFAAFAAVASALLGRGPAWARSAVWLVASAKFALPLALFAYLGSLAGLGAAARPIAAGPALAHAPAVWTFVEPVAAPAVVVGGGPVSSSVYWALTALWLAGATATAGFWLAGRRRLSLAIRAGRAVGAGREREALERARLRLRVGREVGLVVSAAVHEPGVWRVRRPVVVLPEGVGGALDDDELEAVMMHEVAHVARRDNLVSNLQMALCCAFWFHPVVWAIDRKLLAERERACDEAVIGAGGRARVYAAGLLKVFRFAIGWQPAGVSCATGSHLGRRVEQIMNSSERISTNWHRAVIAAVVLGMAGLSATAAVLGQDNKRVERDIVVERGPGEGPGGGDALAATAASAPTVSIMRYDNAAGAPLLINDAQIKKVPAEQLAAAAAGHRVVVRTFEDRVPPPADAKPGVPAEAGAIKMRFPETDADGNALVLLVSLTNTSGRALTGYQLSAGSGDLQFFFAFNKTIEPGANIQIALPVGQAMAEADGAVLTVKGVGFDDGTTWGDFRVLHDKLMVHHPEQ